MGFGKNMAHTQFLTRVSINGAERAVGIFNNCIKNLETAGSGMDTKQQQQYIKLIWICNVALRIACFIAIIQLVFYVHGSKTDLSSQRESFTR